MKLPLNRIWYLAVLCTAVLAFAMFGTANGDRDTNPGVFPPDENVYGMSYGEWSAAWWQYVLAYDNANQPYADTTGALCNQGQGGPVFFLVGGPVNPTNRVCTIPAGKAIFLPIINGECSNVEPPVFYGATGQEARVCAASYNDGTDLKSLKMTIDGKHVKDLDDFRVQSSFYHFNVPSSDNFLGVNGITEGWSVSDGYWVMIRPLAPGVHTLHFEAKWTTGPGAGAYQNVNYTLTVLPH